MAITAARSSRSDVADEVGLLLADHHLEAATALVRSAVAGDELDVEAAVRLHLLLSTVRFLAAEGGAVEEADAALELVEVWELSDDLAVAGRLARLLGLLAEDRIDEARSQANALLAGGDQLGADAALAGALTAFAILAWDDGRVTDALDFVEAAAHRADRGPDEARQMHPRLALAPMLIATDQLAAAARCLDDARREIAQVGDVLWETAPLMFSASLALASGRLDDALADARDAIAHAEQVGARLLLALGRATCASVALLRGDIDEAERQVRRGRADGSPQLGYGSALLIWIESRIAEARGGRDEAVVTAADVLARPHAHRRLSRSRPRLRGSRVSPWRLEIGEPPRRSSRASNDSRTTTEASAPSRSPPAMPGPCSTATWLVSIERPRATAEHGHEDRPRRTPASRSRTQVTRMHGAGSTLPSRHMAKPAPAVMSTGSGAGLAGSPPIAAPSDRSTAGPASPRLRSA